MTNPCRKIKRVQGAQGEIAEVLVVDRVKLASAQHVPHVRNFDDDHARVFQDSPHSSHKTVQVRDVGEDIVGVQNVGALASVP